MDSIKYITIVVDVYDDTAPKYITVRIVPHIFKMKDVSTS